MKTLLKDLYELRCSVDCVYQSSLVLRVQVSMPKRVNPFVKSLCPHYSSESRLVSSQNLAEAVNQLLLGRCFINILIDGLREIIK